MNVHMSAGRNSSASANIEPMRSSSRHGERASGFRFCQSCFLSSHTVISEWPGCAQWKFRTSARHDDSRPSPQYGVTSLSPAPWATTQLPEGEAPPTESRRSISMCVVVLDRCQAIVCPAGVWPAW